MNYVQILLNLKYQIIPYEAWEDMTQASILNMFIILPQLKQIMIFLRILPKNVLKNHFSPLRLSFQFSQQSSPTEIPRNDLDQLSSYSKYLVKHNATLKKPHEKLVKEEQRIVNTYLSEKRYEELINFLVSFNNLTLCNPNTIPTIDKHFSLNWAELNRNQQLKAAYYINSFRHNSTFQIFKSPIQNSLKQKGIKSINTDELLVYLCGEIMNRKNLRFLSKIFPLIKQRKDLYRDIYNLIINEKYTGQFSRQRKRLLSYIGLILDPLLNKKQQIASERTRSPLQIYFQSFLSNIGVTFQRQVKINNYFADYLVKSGQKQIILQVNGTHHYTIDGKLKGYEVLRNLNLNQYSPLRIIHYQDFLLSKGNQNKSSHIEQVLQLKSINWQPKNSGTNTKWQVVFNEQMLKQFDPK